MADEITPRKRRRSPNEFAPGDLAASPAYAELLDDLKAQVAAARSRATLAASQEVLVLYWAIGRSILRRQVDLGWGATVVQKLSDDLRRAYPDMKGFSPRNLAYMRSFAIAWGSEESVRDLGALPWGHHVTLMEKVDDPATRTFYARASIVHGWSRPVLGVQIETRLHDRQGKAVTNFDRAIPPPSSDLARDALKDPYVFDFLGSTEDRSERELEQGLLDQIQRFLLELGVGFAFVGRQFRLDVGGDEFYIDLLFYHLKLRRFVVIELKVVPFQPEFVGKLNFYLAAVDEQLRHPQDQPTIGLLLCKDKNRLVVEYALRGVESPLGVASWEATRARLPRGLADALPTVQDIERELGSALEADDLEGG